MPTLYTLGDLARHFNVTTPQMKYAIDSYRIEARQRLGIIRVWTDEDLPTIKSAIDRIARSNTGGARR